jgi:pimeloyl-ACP methyl ester carboxylesterase
VSDLRASTVAATDGTPIGVHSTGDGPDLLVVGGVLTAGLSYVTLAGQLAGSHRVHLLDRRGRGLSGPQRRDHSIDDECS